MDMYVAKKLDDSENDYIDIIDIAKSLNLFNFKAEYGTMGLAKILNTYEEKDMVYYINSYLTPKYKPKTNKFSTTAYNLEGITQVVNDIWEDNYEHYIIKGNAKNNKIDIVFPKDIIEKVSDKLTYHKVFKIDNYKYCICSYSAKNGKQYKFIARM